MKRYNHKPWITPGILKSIRRKDKLYKQWIIKRTIGSKNKYTAYKNKLTHTLRVAEKLYYTEKFEAIKGDIKRTWLEIKNILNHGPNLCSITGVNSNGKFITNQTDIVNMFNNYFVNVGPSLAKNITKPTGKFQDYVCKACGTGNRSMFVKPTDANEICNIVRNFKPNKSSGFDEISPKVITCVMPYISGTLSHIFNISLSCGTFPDRLKIAKVIPVYKSDDKSTISNYRPISVLPVFSKILERIMYNRLLNYLDLHKILTDKQYGFREKRSTSLALIDLIDKLSEEIDNKKFSVGIFIDLSKAFDTVDHQILLDKLYMYGVRGHVYKWFESYLKNRMQFVQLNDTKSRFARITCGVPQGSILGPLLFILYYRQKLNSLN